MEASHLRSQKIGKQKSWTAEQVAAGFEHFFAEHARYPTATEINHYPYLPSAKSIERNFGGVVAIREQLHLKSDADFRLGSHRSGLAYKIDKRGSQMEKVVYAFLIEHFSKELVHREYFFSDDKRTRADFFVYDNTEGFCVDVFYPNDRHNLLGCLNSKLSKYESDAMRQYPVIFLQMNKEIPQEILDSIIANKKRKVPVGQRLMSWETFEKFCLTRQPRTAAGKRK